MDLRTSVLRWLHSVYDVEPHEVPAVRIASGLPIAYRLTQSTLWLDEQAFTLGESGQPVTLGELVLTVRQSGYSADMLRPEWESRQAVSLLDAHGTSDVITLSAQDSVLWAISLPGALAAQQAQEAMVEAVRQLNFMQAGGGWLDTWGRYFDVPRQDGQSDTDYALFMRREILRPRVNALSIQAAVKDWTGHDIVIREPWRELFIWSKSRWDSTDSRWQDGNFYTFGTIEPRGTLAESKWEEIVPVIQRNRALGCYLFPPVFAIDGFYFNPHPGGAIAVALGVADNYERAVPADLAWAVAFASTDDSYAGFALIGESPRWVGPWDDRSWITGGKTYGVGFVQTDIPA